MIVLAVGDSVMQGAGRDLYATLPAELPGIEVDAIPHRQLRHGAAVVRAFVGGGRPPATTVVVHLGTNGPFGDGEFDELIDAAGPGVPVLVVTVRAPRTWEAAVNDRLAQGVARHGTRSVLVDWHSLAHPEHLCRDGFHLTRAGATAYAAAIATAVHAGPGRAGMLAG